MTAQEIMSRFEPLMPEGVRFSAAYPIQPWQDEEGNWHQPDDTALIRVSTPTHFCDGMVKGDEFAWADDMFMERILAPMLSRLSICSDSPDGR